MDIGKRVFLFASAMAFLCACSSDDDSNVAPEKLWLSYLPLQVGNYWEFTSINTPKDGVVVHREVKGTAQLNGYEYYLIISNSVDSTYYRVEQNGDVYTYRRGMDNEQLSYKLFAHDGDSWSYTLEDGVGGSGRDDVMHVSVNIGSVATERKTVDDCKHYYFDVEQWVDEEHTNTLAPGVGFIREYSDAWGMGMILSKASIGGNVIEY